MAQTIKLKRSATQNAVPTTSQLELGEVALNTYDGKMYIKKSVGGTESIVEIGGDATSSSGLDFTGNLNLEDNVRIVIGDANDLQIYHDGSDSIINENGTGDLKVFSSRFRVISPAGEEMIQALENGTVRLYHNNSQRLATSSTGITVNNAIKIGAASPKIFFSESDTTNLNTRIRSNSGSFQVQTVDNSDANPVTRLAIDNNTGDLRLYEDTGATAKFHWDASAESLGVGTTGPDTTLHVNSGILNQVAKFESSDSTAYLSIKDSTTSHSLHGIGATGNVLQLFSNNSEVIRIDADGRLLVNTTSSVDNFAKIQVVGDSSSLARITLKDVDGTNQYTYFEQSGGGTRINTQNGTSNGFFTIGAWNGTASSDFVRVTSTGQVGIGTTSPSRQLHVLKSGTTSAIMIEAGDGSQSSVDLKNTEGWFRLINDGGSLSVYDQSDTAERFRIDTNGNLLVGKTSTSVTTNGIEARSDGLLAASRDQGAALYATRTTDDGDIAKFYSGSTNVGTFGSNQNQFLIDSKASNIVISANGGASSIITKGTLRPLTDNTNDLGISTRRYQDLFLAGTIYGGSTLTLDPAAHGDDTGTVVIAGNLQVDGTTTTINSTTLTVDDKNITLASGSTNKAAANGAGITVDCGSDTDATFTYDGTNDEWDFNKNVKISGSVGVTNIVTNKLVKHNGTILDDSNITDTGSLITLGSNTTVSGSVTSDSLTITGTNANLVFGTSGNNIDFGRNADNYISAQTGTSSNIVIDPQNRFVVRTSDTERLRIDASGNILHQSGSPEYHFGTDSANHYNWRVAAQEAVNAGFEIASGTQSAGSGALSDTYTTRFVIKADTGNVGIGNNNPSTPLVVQSNSNAQGITILGRSSDDISQLDFSENDGASIGGIQARTTDFRIRSVQNIPLLFMTNNTERARIDASGNVGIGINTPSRKLDVSASGNDGIRIASANALIGGGASGGDTQLIYWNGSNAYYGRNALGGSVSQHQFRTAGLTRLTIDSSGRVGIGTTSPGAPLDVKSNSVSSGNSGIRLISNSAGNAIVRIGEKSNDKARLHMYDGTTEKIAFYTDGTANHISAGNLGIGTASPEGLMHFASSSEYAIVFDYVGQEKFKLRHGTSGVYFTGPDTNTLAFGITHNHDAQMFSTSGSAYATFDGSTSRVGIGTQSPGTKLHIADSATPVLRISHTAGTAQNVDIYNSGGTMYLRARNDTANGPIIFQGGGGGTNTEYARFQSTGYLGVGTTGPARRLHVKDTNYSVARLERDGAGAGVALEFRNGDGNIWQIGNDGDEVLRFYYAGSNRFQITSSGAARFNSAFTLPTSDGGSNQVLKTDGSGNVTWATVQGVGTATEIADADGDTKIQVEESSDEDVIRFDTAGSQRMVIDSGGNFGFGVDTPSNYFHVKKNSTGIIARIEGASGRYLYTGTDALGHYLEQVGTSSTDRVLRIQNSNGSGQYTQIFLDGHNQRIYTNGAAKVGIGTSSLTNQFHVSGNARIEGNLMAGSSAASNIPARPLHVKSTGDNAALRIEDSTSSNTVFDFRVTHGEGLRFINVTGGITPLFVGTDGNVGIGTTSPNSELEVKGATPIVTVHATTLTGTTLGDKGPKLLFRADSSTAGNGGEIVFAGASDSDVERWAAISGHISSNTVNGCAGHLVFATKETSAGTSLSERMRITNTGNVGIGDTAPSKTLTVNGTFKSSGEAFFSHFDNTTSNSRMRDDLRLNFGTARTFAIAGNSTNMHMKNGTTNVMTFDTSNRVGIGTASPAKTLDVAANGSSQGIHLNISGVGRLQMYADGDRNYFKGLSGNGHRFTTTGGANVEIQNGGNVGIGTTAPQAVLDLGNGTNGRGIAWGGSNGTAHYNTIWSEYSSASIIIGAGLKGATGSSTFLNPFTGTYGYAAIELDSFSDDGIKFYTGADSSRTKDATITPTEHMRLTPYGYLMIGKTNPTFSTSGIELRGGNLGARFTRSNAEPMLVNRTGSNGDIVKFYGQTTELGAITAEGGDSLIIQSAGSTGTGLRFHPNRAAVEPVRAGATIDDTISLGADTRRFKDLHLSNAANIGHASIETSNTSTTATTQVAIATFAAATFRSAEFTIQVTNSTDSTYHITKVLLIHDGTTPGITEYGTVFTGSAAEATFDADISSGNVRLLATPASADSMTFKVVRHCITV